MPLAYPSPIETRRLQVRAFAESDLPALMKVNGDDKVTHFLPYATWRSMDDARAWFKRMTDFQASGASLQFVVVDKATSNAIGTCLLFRFEEANGQAELGFVLGREYCGAGFMLEALDALIDKAFTEMPMRRLEAVADSHNASSTQLLRRLGFVKEGVLRERWLVDGATADAEVHGLLRREWRKGSAK